MSSDLSATICYGVDLGSDWFDDHGDDMVYDTERPAVSDWIETVSEELEKFNLEVVYYGSDRFIGVIIAPRGYVDNLAWSDRIKVDKPMYDRQLAKKAFKLGEDPFEGFWHDLGLTDVIYPESCEIDEDKLPFWSKFQDITAAWRICASAD